MTRAIELARRGEGRCEPNPMVGAVVVKNGEIVGEGWHASFGGPHAEIMALENAGDAATGADLHVTLEPCSTTGQTPPCVDAVIQAAPSQVFVGANDPNPKHTGRGIELLRDAGIKVKAAVAEPTAESLLERFRFDLASERPFVVAKWAQTLDGFIADADGRSKWITGPAARRRVHEERARCQGILVGIETVLADDPSLTVRDADGACPHRFVIDTQLRTPVDSKLVTDGAAMTTIIGAETADESKRRVLEEAGVEVLGIPIAVGGFVDAAIALRHLRESGIERLLIEGGGRVFGSFLDQGLIDRVQAFIAPRILNDPTARPALSGHRRTLGDAIALRDTRIETFDSDILMEGWVD